MRAHARDGVDTTTTMVSNVYILEAIGSGKAEQGCIVLHKAQEALTSCTKTIFYHLSMS